MQTHDRPWQEGAIYLFIYLCIFRGHTITHEIRGTNHAVTQLLLTPDTYTETRLSKYNSSLVTVNTALPALSHMHAQQRLCVDSAVK